nr:MFS transporter [Yoonia maritima]
MISLYAMLTLSLTVVVNRIYGEWIDNGRRIAPLILTSILAFGFALCAMLVFKTYAVLIFICAPCFALSNAAVSTMYSFGHLSAEQNGWDIARYNSYLRATTSLGWMIAPAVTFLIAGAFGASYVMISALVLTAVWATLWWMVMPRDFVKQSRIKDPSTDGGNLSGNAKAMWTAAGVCLLFSLAHSATTSSLP